MEAYFDLVINSADVATTTINWTSTTYSVKSTTVIQDMVPSDISTRVDDTTSDQVETISTGTAGTDYGCTQQWTLTVPDSYCVQFKAILERPLSTGDTTYDFIIDVTKTYKVRPFAGPIESAQEPIFFTTQDVDFTKLGTEEAAGASSGINFLLSVGILYFASILF